MSIDKSESEISKESNWEELVINLWKASEAPIQKDVAESRFAESEGTLKVDRSRKSVLCTARFLQFWRGFIAGNANDDDDDEF